MKKTTLSLAVAITSLSLAAPIAHAGDVTAYGRVLYNLVDDDNSDDLQFQRHQFAESTIGVKANHKVNDITYGAQVEIGLQEGVAAQNNGRNRIQQLSIKKEGIGAAYLGTGPTITWVISDVDQSGTWIADPLGVSSRFGATRAGAASVTPFTRGQTIFSERLRLDSAKLFDGLTLHAQLGESGSYEFAAKYLANGIRANAWYVDNGEDDTGAGVFGDAEASGGFLVGYKHSSGINITGTHVITDLLNTPSDPNDGGEKQLTAIKIGYTKGKHAVSFNNGEYTGEDADGVDDADHSRRTLSYVFSPTGGVKLWVQSTSTDTDGADSDTAFAIGGMVKI